MKWVVAIVGLVVVVVGITLFARSPGGSGPAPGAPGAPAEAQHSPTPPAGGGSAIDPAEQRALDELRAELAHAPTLPFRSDEQRLEEARAWVAANRPAGRAFNEIEAKILALMDVLADGDKRSAEWTMNMSQIEVEMIRAIDADGDGQVSDSEVQLFIDENVGALFNPMEHPYLQEKFDTNGDGTVGPEEMTRFATEMTSGALAGAIERGKLESWDTDHDGSVNDEERVAGEQAVNEQVDEMFRSFMPESAESALFDMSEEEQAALDPEAAKRMEAARTQVEAAREMLASQLAAKDLMEAMRVDNLESPDPVEFMESMPKPPDPTSFDDGDGVMTEAETAAQTQAMTDYQAQVEQWGAELTARRLKAQFDNATAQHDSDGDGRMSDAEWESRIGDLIYERDQRLYLRSYDLDSSGRVDAGELTTYLNWYRTGSLRADVNFDGDIDARDLTDMATRFQQQGR